MIAITGASGQLGRLAITELLKSAPASQLIAIVRDPTKVSDLAAAGINIRQADYRDEAALNAALNGAERLLFISSSEVGQRSAQHRHVINAAHQAGVKFIAYTSLLHADRSPLGLAAEHVETEAMLAQSGIPYALLRNGWYVENYLASLKPALEHGVLMGCAGDGKIAAAPRADYAAAAASVMTQADPAGRGWELAADEGWTLSQLAAEAARISGKPLVYRNLSEDDYKAVLLDAGLPEGLAVMLANSDSGAAQGGLYDDGHQLSQLLGRPTTPLTRSLSAALS